MGEEVRYIWHGTPVPDHLEITQIYGYLICRDTARVLIQDDEGTFNLPGGKPEPCDFDAADTNGARPGAARVAWGGSMTNDDFTRTLIREAFEENQVVVVDAAYLGYQEVLRPGRAPYAQVRLTGVIGSFEQRAPDPDGGRIYRRLMTSLAEAPRVLGWGEPAEAQVAAAARVAQEKWGLPVTAPAPTGYVD